MREKRSNHLNVLILEDVPSDADLIQHELRKAKLNFDARCAQTEEEFVRELDDGPIDVILSDYSLPQFDALAALEMLTGQLYLVTVIGVVVGNFAGRRRGSDPPERMA